jgi:hypothetical protein
MAIAGERSFARGFFTARAASANAAAAALDGSKSRTSTNTRRMMPTKIWLRCVRVAITAPITACGQARPAKPAALARIARGRY